jgi:PHD/YefM family antitoxin component YafN of YafNO toxin-antitoxin module
MPVIEHSQSLSEFQQAADETLDRLAQTGEVEYLTVDGEARGVVMSPAAYDALVRDAEYLRRVARMRQSIQEHEDGKGIEVHAAFEQMRQKLLALQAAGHENLHD